MEVASSNWRLHQQSAIFALFLVVLVVPSSAAPQSVGVVSYIYPCTKTTDCAWDAIDAGAPAVGIALVNPDSGPGSAYNSDYADQVTRTKSTGINVFGYVHTSYAARNMTDVEREVGRYLSWYGVSQIFFDEVSTQCSDVAYYAALANIVRANAGNSSPAIIINPGTDTNECYAAVADIIVGFEDSAAAYVNFSPTPWMRNTTLLAPSRVWHMVYDVSSAGAPGVAALAAQRNAGLIFITDATLPNPYGVLPTYFALEVAGWPNTTTLASLSSSPSRAPSRMPSSSRTISKSVTPTPSMTKSATSSRSSTKSASESRTGTRSAKPTPSQTRSSSPSRTGSRSSRATNSSPRTATSTAKSKSQ